MTKVIMANERLEIEIPEGKRVKWVNGVLTLVDDKPIEDNAASKPIKCKNIFTKCYSEEDALALARYIVCDYGGYEGVQNDSFRYCAESVRWCIKDNFRHNINYIYVGINTYQLVVGTNKKYMRAHGSTTYIEKERIFKQQMDKSYPY